MLEFLAYVAITTGNTPCGQVHTPLSIATSEVSNDEYVSFLNAEAASDPYGLFNPLMEQHFLGGIVRQRVAESFRYSTKDGYGRLPVTFVSWSDAARYANWLGSGNTESGSYDMAKRRPMRRKGAIYVIPTCAEWLAAARLRKSENLATSAGWREPFPHLTNVDGQFYGNVSEWAENVDGSHRRILGGSLFMSEAAARSLVDSEESAHELGTIGIRLAKFDRSPATIRTSVLDWMQVGDPDNAPDENGRGSVRYNFEIMRTEISNDQYVEFLNAVAREDRFGLYSKDMGTGIGGGIDRLGKPGSYFYRAKRSYGRRAVNYLHWFALARMANWYHYGQPLTGRSTLETTEGTALRGAYDTRQFGQPEFTRTMLKRNVGARYFIPSDAEWTKAAYYRPGGWWKYPFQSNQAEAGRANFISGVTMGEGAPYFISDVDQYSQFPSHWGTVQQGGNLWEWTEDWREAGDCWRCDELTKGLRGGSFNYTWRGLDRGNIDPGIPDQASFVVGGRLARIQSGFQPAPKADHWFWSASFFGLCLLLGAGLKLTAKPPL